MDKKKKEQIDTHDYEHNLKLYNESIRKDLDIILTSMIPTQKNLMKTLLWLNSSIIGLILATMSKDINIIYVLIPFIFSFLAILIILLSLKDGRVKYLGSPSIKDIENISITKAKNKKVLGLIAMNESIYHATERNFDSVKKRGAKIGKAITLTIISMASIPLLLILWYNLPNLNIGIYYG